MFVALLLFTLAVGAAAADPPSASVGRGHSLYFQPPATKLVTDVGNDFPTATTLAMGDEAGVTDVGYTVSFWSKLHQILGTFGNVLSVRKPVYSWGATWTIPA